MSTRIEVLLWATRIVARKGGAPHELLEIREDATLEQAQEAFHKVAKIAHPDLHRTTLDAGELEKVTTAYAYVAAAYQAMRVAKVRGGRAGSPTGPPPVGETARVKRPTEQTSNVVRLPGGGIVGGGRGAATRPPLTKAVTAPLPTTKAKPAPTPGPAPAAAPAAETGPLGPNPSTVMNSKALVYYRKAEMALRQGDMRMALLNLKMAIASDPASSFLRQALAEVESELKAT